MMNVSSPSGRNRTALVFAAGLLALAAVAAWLAYRQSAPPFYVLAVVLGTAGLLVPQALLIANQWERAVVLRLGKLRAIRGPGLFAIVPFIDSVSAWLDQRIQTTEFNAEQALSKDTVPVNVDAVVFWQVHDPKRAALEITDYREAIARVAQTSLREMVGSSLLSTLLADRKQGDALL